MSAKGFCTWDMGLLTDCGDDAVGKRAGFPLCSKHIQTYDILTDPENQMPEEDPS